MHSSILHSTQFSITLSKGRIGLLLYVCVLQIMKERKSDISGSTHLTSCTLTNNKFLH